MAIADEEKTLIRLAIGNAEKANQSRMQIRTTTAIELGGQALVSSDDMSRLEALPAHDKDLMTSLVDVAKLKQVVK